MTSPAWVKWPAGMTTSTQSCTSSGELRSSPIELRRSGNPTEPIKAAMKKALDKL